MNNDTQPLTRKERCRLHYLANKERLIEYSRSNYKANKERHKATVVNWRTKNKDSLNKQLRDRYYTDLNYKLGHALGVRLAYKLKKSKVFRDASAIDFLGCTIDEARKHIEAQWQSGMSWANHTRNGWHIDHIRPINTFDLTDPDQRKQCFHYTNLRPLWASQNCSRPIDGSDLSLSSRPERSE